MLIGNFTVNVVMVFCLLISITAINSSVCICYAGGGNRTSGGCSPQELDWPLDCKAVREIVLENYYWFYIPFSVTVFQNMEGARSVLKICLKKAFLHIAFYCKISSLKYIKQVNH